MLMVERGAGTCRPKYPKRSVSSVRRRHSVHPHLVPVPVRAEVPFFERAWTEYGDLKISSWILVYIVPMV